MSNPQVDSRAFRERVVELGILTQHDADQAYEAYLCDGDTQVAGQHVTFASFLLEKELITVSQLAQIAQADPDKTLVDAFADPEIGQIYSDCAIEQLLGSGGMGSVYLATRQPNGEKVVVKVLAPRHAGNEALRARFEREGEVLRSLPPHPNIVAVPEVHATGTRPHILMDYVEGLSLERVLEERWSLPPLEAARLVRDIARGMSVIHEHGIIHRDMKPANVLLTPDGVVKIVDFGLAKDVYGDTLTQAGMKLGTPFYMAPEQWGDHEVDHRCDIFALGATFYHLLVGEPPFQGRDKEEIAERIMAGEYVPPRRIVPDLSKDLELVVMQMLMPDRRFRYPRMSACADDLDHVLSGQPPRIPCVFSMTKDGQRAKRYPLLPGKTFTVGREIDCDLIIPDSSVSRRHAMLRRESTGFVLRDLGSSFGSFVNEMRVVRPVGLKSGDCVRMGRVMLEFRDPVQVVQSRNSAPEDVKRERLNEPAVDALVSLGDKRTVLHLLEQLEQDKAALGNSTKHLTQLLGEDTALEVRKVLEKKSMRRRSRTPMLLFAITSENLGKDVGEWLAWWDRTRTSQPDQIGMAQPPHLLRLKILGGEAGLSDLALDDAGGVFQLGRDEGCRLPLSNRTVSRLHATIFRLHRRFVIRDEGSRLGTVVNGNRVRLAFLEPGDEIELGAVKMRVELQDEEELPQAGVGLYGIEPHVFEALVDLDHPSVATALVGFLHEKESPEWAQWTAATLYPAEDEEAQKFVETVDRHYGRWIDTALELLPNLLGQDAGDSPVAWSQLLATRRSELGPQFLPTGWLEGSRDLYAGSNAGQSLIPE